ncbi:ribokinase [Sporosarcina sp. 179-K 8C2 HS]|uniref:ribokinase n=1 Tax=Sporosarcina sp. 179-K 8C2 HS TaxID=3142387 RepID=UPI0039A09502
MGQTPKITVVGSINMDLVTITDQLPKMGETILGQQFQMNPGGKGANQAVASARLGAAVQLIGCVGEDMFGKELLQHLNSEGVDVSHVEQVSDQTGTASIIVSKKDNNIIVVPGANNHVTASFVEAKREVIAASDILILQLEIPLEGVQKAIEIAKENGVTVILNPAPICELPADVLTKVDYLTPNEHEYKHLTIDDNRAELIGKVILTKGSEGVSYFQDDEELNIPAYSIDVVDTTGAGDSFNAGFAVALGKGLPVDAACRYGNAVAALSTTKLGAQTGMPTDAEVQEFINKTN